MERRGPSHSSPYAKACASCFKAKCKCVARADGPGCQRCHRLNKTCQPSGSVRRRTILNKQNSNAQIAELAKKLDGLIERLESHNAPGSDSHREHQVGSQAQSLNSGDLGPSSDAFVAENEPQDGEDMDTVDDEVVENITFDLGFGGPTTTAFKGWDSVPDAETDALLSIFRSRMLQHFPFVHLPAQLTAYQLRRNRPLLLRAIVCVASRRNMASQSSELKHAMGEALLLEDTDKTDLLLSLLTYISWGWDHSNVMSRLMMQAMSLACEIANPILQDMDVQMRALFIPAINTDIFISKSHFLERQRAVLGCFVLSSAVSSYFRHIDALRWTPQMDEALATLSTNRECPTDTIFAVQVRLQLLWQKAAHIRQQQQMEQGHMQAPTGTTSVPALVSLMALQEELEGLQASLSLSEKSVHLAQVSTTELVINEARHGLYEMVPKIISHFSAMTGSSLTGSDSAKGTERSLCLWKCVNAIKTYNEALLAISVPDFAGISFVQWAQLARNVVVLNQVTTTIKDPSWDRAAASAIIDMPMFLDRVSEKLELAAQVTREQESDGAFTRLASRMRNFCSNLAKGTARDHGSSENITTRSRIYRGAWGGALTHIPVSNYFT